MPINTIDDYSTTAANNIDLQGFSIQGTAAVSNFDNALRELMVDIATSPLSATAIGTVDGINTQGTAIASAGTTNLATATGVFVSITGTTTITSFGTVAAGAVRVLRFADGLKITHNATSMILPQSADITTAANDMIVMRSLGGGNWICENHLRSAYVVKPVWESIDTRTLSLFASWSVINLSPFQSLRITGFFKPSTDAVLPHLQTSDDNGATWTATAGAYDYQATYSTSTTVAGFGGVDTKIDLAPSSTGNAAGEGINFEIIANNFNTTDYTYFTINTDSVNSSGARYTMRMMARRVSATAQNGIRILFASGSLSGPIRLEGVRA